MLRSCTHICRFGGISRKARRMQGIRDWGQSWWIASHFINQIAGFGGWFPVFEPVKEIGRWMDVCCRRILPSEKDHRDSKNQSAIPVPLPCIEISS